jgi:hypothetical protein
MVYWKSSKAYFPEPKKSKMKCLKIKKAALLRKYFHMQTIRIMYVRCDVLMALTSKVTVF